MTGRMTFQKLLRITATRFYDCRKQGTHPDAAELIIPYQVFQDLKSDVEFLKAFNWSVSDRIPSEFKCHGIKCVIERFAGERVVL